MPYTYITYLQAKTALAQRLYDVTQRFYSDAECGVYVKESLQSFNALANFYREEFTFTASPTVTWYDLTALPGTLRSLSFTDADILSAIEYHILEPQTATYPLAWTGTLQFNLSDILNAIQQLRDQILSESNCTVTQSLIAAVPGRTFLTDTAIQLRRVCWIPVTGQGYTPNALIPLDVWGQQSFEAGFTQLAPGYPSTYRRSTEPPLSFDVDIQPAVPGQYDVLTVNAGTELTTTASSILPIPNDWCWANKWGALAQLLGRDSAAMDTFRAQYCLMRYKHAMMAMQSAPALMAARINDIPVVVESVANADYYAANWQGITAGSPTDIYYAGLNQLALSPTPDAGLYSITASVVRNMPLPTADADFVQIGRDDVSAVLDYAQHLALFKCGGSEFAQTEGLLKNFMRHCALYNSKLAALSQYLEFIDGRGHEDERINPTFNQLSPATAGGVSG